MTAIIKKLLFPFIAIYNFFAFVVGEIRMQRMIQELEDTGYLEKPVCKICHTRTQIIFDIRGSSATCAICGGEWEGSE